MLTMQMVNAPVFVSHQSRDGFPFQLALVKQSAEYCILAACEMIDLLQALSECGFDFSAWDVLYCMSSWTLTTYSTIVLTKSRHRRLFSRSDHHNGVPELSDGSHVGD